MDQNTSVVLATIVGPLAAVIITLWHQGRKEKMDAKFRLFLSLMAHRKSNPPSVDWVNGLNLIDVVFSDCPKVISAWHQFYEYLHVKPMDMRLYNIKTLDMLTEMARALGYKSLKQTDIDKFYSPEAFGETARTSNEMQAELLRALKAISTLGTAAQATSSPNPPVGMPQSP